MIHIVSMQKWITCAEAGIFILDNLGALGVLGGSKIFTKVAA